MAETPRNQQHKENVMAKVIHNRDKLLHPNAAYIGRGPGGCHMNNTPIGEPGWLGNPHRIGPGMTREESIRRFREDFYRRLEDDEAFRTAVLILHGRDLVCFCKPLTCHGDVILEWLEVQAGKNRTQIVKDADSVLASDRAWFASLPKKRRPK